MHNEITTPSEAQIQKAQRILSKVRKIDQQRRALAKKEETLLAKACKLLNIPILEVP